MQHVIKNFLDHGIRNTDFLKLAVKAAAGFKGPFKYVNHSGPVPHLLIYLP